MSLMQILIVDTRGGVLQEAIESRVAEIFPAAELQFSLTTSGSEALGLVMAHAYDFVVTNLHLRTFVTGHQVVRAAQRRGQYVVSVSSLIELAPIAAPVVANDETWLEGVCNELTSFMQHRAPGLLPQESRA